MSPHPAVREFMRRFFTEGGGRPVKGQQKDIANMVGVAPATVSRWFSGSTSIDPQHWPRLAQAAGLVTERGEPDVDAVGCMLDPQQDDERVTLAALADVKASIDAAIAEAADDRRALEIALRELTREVKALTELVTAAIAARAAARKPPRTKPGNPSPPRSSRGSSQSRT